MDRLLKKRVANHASGVQALETTRNYQVLEVRQCFAECEEQVHAAELAAEHRRQELGGSLRLAAALLDLGELFLVMSGQIVDALLQMSAEDQGRQVAEVRSAIELSEDQQERLAAALKSATGRDVDVRVVVDPTVVGGLVVRVGDQVIDGTVRHRLSQLRESLSARS